MANQKLPELTAEQRKVALEKAAKVRKERAEIKKSLKEGKLKVSEVLAKADDDTYGKMTVRSVIESLPGVGKARAAKIMEEIGISETRRVKGLGPKQVQALKERFS
ncbi:integration host factor, actinobacterial type [Candidatus Solincola tengchongensis]|uniref:integration host factor, actinobacterial type n=1 Tax=Candidatus Solincola tengchongensis TaxID=2900693 RepID=UPI00257A2DAA|nr:integration host factor, actinobacterial type [Candidatus Solincola tengchongensis]